MHFSEVFKQCPIRCDPAQSRLPGVHVSVDQAGDDDAACRIDHLSILRLDRADLCDPIVLDENAPPHIAQAGVHRDNGRALNDRPLHFPKSLAGQSVTYPDVLWLQLQTRVPGDLDQQCRDPALLHQ